MKRRFPRHHGLDGKDRWEMARGEIIIRRVIIAVMLAVIIVVAAATVIEWIKVIE